MQYQSENGIQVQNVTVKYLILYCIRCDSKKVQYGQQNVACEIQAGVKDQAGLSHSPLTLVTYAVPGK